MSAHVRIETDIECPNCKAYLEIVERDASNPANFWDEHTPDDYLYCYECAEMYEDWEAGVVSI